MGHERARRPVRRRRRATAARRSPIVSPPNEWRSWSARTSATIASPTIAARGRTVTSLRSMCARPDSPVSRSTAGERVAQRRDRLLGGAHDDRLAVAHAALDAARAVRRVRAQPVPRGSTTSWTALPRAADDAEAEPDLDALDRRDRHHGAGQQAVEARIPLGDRAQADRARPSATTTNDPPIESPASWRHRPRRSSRARRRGPGSAAGTARPGRASAHPAGCGAGGRPSSGKARTGPELVDEAPDPHAAAVASSWRRTAPAATRGASSVPRRAPGRRGCRRCRT